MTPLSVKVCATSLLPLLLLLALPVVVQAQFNYTTINGTVTITGYTGSGGAVSIPSEINGLPVTSIGTQAFMLCTSLSSVTIPNTVTSIGVNAFMLCTSLSSVTIPNSVINIQYGAFARCYNLVAVTIPNSVTSIGNGAFYDCTSLTAITVDTANPSYSSVDGVLFDKSQTTLIEYPGGKAGSYTIPNGVTGIGDEAFGGCADLTTVTIPNSVTSIGKEEFVECPGLTAITVDTLNSTYSSVDGVLFDKSQTTLIEYPGGKAGSYTIPNGVTGIADWAFGFCYNLTSIAIPNSVISTGDYEFYGCWSLTSVTIGTSVTSIGQEAFWNCGALTSVTIPNSVTNIGGSAFMDCRSVTAVYFQGNAPSLGDSYVFDGDNNATVYYLPGTKGWGTTFDGRPTALWRPPMQATLSSFGVRTNQFGFNINWASGMTVVVEAATNLANPTWSPVATNTLTSGSAYFSDPQWAQYPGRFYRLRWP